jgi:hypothetical protein
MNPQPIAVGLVLAQDVIVEEGTRSITLVKTFNRLEIEEFPSPPQQFAVYTMLTNGRGEPMVGMSISRLDSLEEIYRRAARVTFADPLRQVRLWFRVKSCSFPEPGAYQVTLEADGELITQCVCNIVRKENKDG